MRLSERRGRRALVTGLAGFTGQHMAEYLENEGYEVWGTVSPEPASEAESEAGSGFAAAETPSHRHLISTVDLLDAEGMKALVADARPDVVVHLAGAAHVANGTASNTYLVNIVGTRNLLAALASLDKPPRAVLLASSANVYGNAPVETLDESIAPSPANDYAVSKLAMEHAARLWMDRLPIIVTRPFNYTGVGQREDYLLPKIVGHYARREAKISLGNLHVSRDFSDVRNVVAMYGGLLEAAPAGETFNICSGTGHSLREVLAMLARIAGYEIDVFVDPRFLRANEVHRLVGSNHKLQRVIGQVPSTPLGETLEWMYEAASGREETVPERDGSAVG
ncbi:NAD-dependent epimerase/dehydratase family protein [Trinickia terrae]|uniref:NAD-dependent epimerase/dehydratase family protein n=1 Tax=Trinickia terrae TaxID=2571161 RepID=A0A4U1I3J0_9BURK|nr:GDP-mannose 4,6-dehydratase [Trinickia terrae]TKC87806.1 NAD-dependent epimerase/dehydratase family protein [Trinickia terrae]